MDVKVTLSEAASILDPPMTETQIRAIINALGWPPAGTSPNGRRGRPQHTYPWADITALHALLAPWLQITYANGHATHPQAQI